MNINLQNFFNDYSKYQQLQASQTQNGEEVAASDETQKLTSINMENIKPGDVFYGEITDIRNMNVTILLDDGQQVNAYMQQALGLNIGDKINFQVKSMSDNQIVIRPYQNNDISMELINRSLLASGLKLNDKNSDIVRSLIQHEQPIDKQTIIDILKSVNLYGIENLDEIVEMKKHGIAVNQDNLNQYQKYINNNYQLSNSIVNFQNEMVHFFDKMNGNSKSEIISFLDNLNQILDALSDEKTTADINNTNNSKENLQNNIQNSERIEKSNGQNNEPMNKSIIEPMLEQSNELVNNEVDGSIKVLNGKLEGKIDDQLNTDKNQNSNLLNTVMKDTAENFADSIQKNAAAAQQDLHSNNNTDIKNQIITDKESINKLLSNETLNLNKIVTYLKNNDIDQYDLAQLLKNDNFKKVIKKEIKDHLFIDLEKVNNPNRSQDLQNEVNKVYKKLENLMDEVNQFSQDNKEAASMNDLAKNIKNNLSFMNEMNQINSFLQLPLKMTSGKEANGDLYVFRRNKKKADPADTVSAFLHLDLENLGATDVDIRMTKRNVKTTFIMNNSDSQRLIEQHIGELKNALEKKGYQIMVEVKENVSKNDKPTAIDYLTQKDEKAISVKRYTLDIRT